MSYNDQEYDGYEYDRRPAYSQRRDHGRRTYGLDDPLEDPRDFMENAFRRSAEEMGRAPVGKTGKFLGIFEVDEGLLAPLYTGYNLATDYAGRYVQKNAFPLAEKVAPSLNIPKDKARHVGAALAIGATVAMKAGGYVGTIWEGFSKQRDERVKLARTLAPVLDDLKGQHSVSALFSVKESDNEVIYAHRRRLSKIAQITNFNNLLDTGVNSGANLVLDVKRFGTIWGTKSYVSEAQIAQREQQSVQDDPLSSGTLKEMGRGLSHVVAPQFAKRLKATNQHKLETTMQHYSALEMILELNEQVASDPKARGFQTPTNFNGQRAREQYSLEKYLMRVCIQHQKDMADISPNHTEIREALKDDLTVAIKPIASAIRNREMDVMSLIRLVGEGKLIKNRGRAIASAEEVEALVRQQRIKSGTKSYHADPAEYYKEAPFTARDFRKALAALDGDEKLVFASMFSDEMLADAGLSKSTIKRVGEMRAKGYDRQLTEALIGANLKTDEALKADGLASNEISELRDDYRQIEQGGLEAIQNLKVSADNPKGVERILANLMVPKIIQEPKYLGKLLKDGREQFAKVATNDAHTGLNDGKQGKSLKDARRDYGDTSANDDGYVPEARTAKKVSNGYTHREDARRSQPDDFDRGYD